MWKLIKKYLKDNRGFWATLGTMALGAAQGAAKQKGAQTGQYNSGMSNAIANLGAPVAGRGNSTKFAALKDDMGNGILQGLGAGMAQEQANDKAKGEAKESKKSESSFSKLSRFFSDGLNLGG